MPNQASPNPQHSHRSHTPKDQHLHSELCNRSSQAAASPRTPTRLVAVDDGYTFDDGYTPLLSVPTALPQDGQTGRQIRQAESALDAIPRRDRCGFLARWGWWCVRSCSNLRDRGRSGWGWQPLDRGGLSDGTREVVDESVKRSEGGWALWLVVC
jgi:hypothetical protein